MFKTILIFAAATFLAITTYAQKDSDGRELAKETLMAPPNPKARAEAYRNVEKDKLVLEAKLREGASAQEIHEAKQKLQTDRVEKNREDYKSTKDVKEVRP